jgi:hypothetical protein
MWFARCEYNEHVNDVKTFAKTRNFFLIWLTSFNVIENDVNIIENDVNLIIRMLIYQDCLFNDYEKNRENEKKEWKREN